MKRDYLLQRPGSQNWRLRLQLDGKAVETSLHTPDRALADVRALPLIAEHKRKLLERQPHVAQVREYDFEPNITHTNPEGGTIVATPELLIYLNDNGAVTKTAPNGRMAFRLIEGDKLSPQAFAKVALDAMRTEVGTPRPTLATKNGDDDLIESYLKHSGLTGYPLKECRETWALFRELNPGVKLKDATRDHGRKLAAHFEAQRPPVKAATIQHKIARLAAACNFQIKEGRLTFNPFSGVVKKPKRGEAGASDRRKPFSDDDMKVIRDNLDKLTPADRLLVTVLATTGMRLGEALEIENEATESGVRYCTIGTKTETSMRRVPFPAMLLPLLPTRIDGKLFADDDAHNASERLRRFLQQIGVHVPRIKVAHSFRHRAQDRLRAAECPEDIRWAILGHEERTVAAGYGEGFAGPVLKRWIDRIGI